MRRRGQNEGRPELDDCQHGKTLTDYIEMG